MNLKQVSGYWRRVGGCIACCLLCACGQRSAFVRPELPVPSAWTQAGPAGGVVASDVHWTRYFLDPQLHRLIAVALENNRDLRIAAGRVQEARAQFGIAKADLGPTVNLMGAQAMTFAPSEVSGVGSAVTNQRFDLSLSSVSFEIDFWGRVASLTESARRTYLATEESKKSVYLSLVADVALSYLTVLQMRELIDLERTTLAAHQESLGVISQAMAIGGANDFEYQQALGQSESAKSVLAGFEHQETVAFNRLRYLLGSISVQVQPGATLDEQGMDGVLASGLAADVLLSRPDVVAAEQRLLASHANIQAARAAFFPKVVLTTGVGFASQALASLFSGGGWSYQPMLTLPLFDGGRTKAGLKLSEARNVIAVAEYERVIQLAFREVADLLSSRASLAQQLRSSQLTIKVQARRLEIARGRFNAGVVGYLEVLSAQRELLAARQMVSQVRRAQLEANVQLYKALGGGQEGKPV